MTVEQIIFLALAGVAVLCALAAILARNPVHCGALVVLSFFNVAGLFAMLGADFLAVAQVIIYGGAIMVLVVFVVMLVQMDRLPEMHAGHPVQMVVAPIVGLAAFLEVVAAIAAGVPLGRGGPWTPEAIMAVGGPAQAFGLVLYTEYLFPFVVVSLVLLVAAVGAMVLARPSRTEEIAEIGTISLSRARARTGVRRLEGVVVDDRTSRGAAAAQANAALDQTPSGRRERGQ